MTQLQPRRNIRRILEDLPVSRIDCPRDAERLCDYIGGCAIPDLRFQLWEVTVSSADPFTVGGYASNPWALNALKKAAEALGTSCDVRNVHILPECGVYSFGLARRVECPLFSDEAGSDRVDTVLEDDALIVLRSLKTRALVQAPNGYLGWADHADFQMISPDEWVKRVSSGGARDSRLGVLAEAAQSLLGVPYVWGGASAAGIDCSGFTRWVYRRIGINLPRDADQQFAVGTISALPNLDAGMRLGDLLFFSGDYGGISHVGMALNSEEFIHARGGRGVVITRLDEDPELMARFVWSKRAVV